MRPLSAEPRYLHRDQSRAAAPRAMRRDPAPSRLAYRLERLWLTPFVRAFTRIGVPVFAVTLGLGIWLGDEGRRAELMQDYQDIKTAVQNRPEFMVSLMKIEGASPEVDTAIRAMLPVQLPASSFAIDLDNYRDTIAKLDAVRDVSIVVRSGGLLEVRVTEREPAILWRTVTGIEMLDETGHRVATLLDRAARSDLPLIAGEGADAAVPEALEILESAQPILPRTRGLVRMGERRWDLVLDHDQRILLPETEPARAVERLLALDAAEDLLARDFTQLDLRNRERPTLRLSATAMDTFKTLAGQTIQVKATP
ncbi:cell division protein FtsQ/DivIB [Sinirhodobacter sp. WL0062]|uniref:Cell division protein FtsQ n=1 Tax=Rhodobacter flavimaris TaxID=2907145 RepID=A0ABS8YYM2_9RHOB|nr:cell division protein FtsQ/DivIB [Sinirhodobacter sp. WL0062]MCE5974603.1 cell division protein FtsQ/DivIB [Sinirhodobacter sp. WL0062]